MTLALPGAGRAGGRRPPRALVAVPPAVLALLLGAALGAGVYPVRIVVLVAAAAAVAALVARRLEVVLLVSACALFLTDSEGVRVALPIAVCAVVVVGAVIRGEWTRPSPPVAAVLTLFVALCAWMAYSALVNDTPRDGVRLLAAAALIVAFVLALLGVVARRGPGILLWSLGGAAGLGGLLVLLRFGGAGPGDAATAATYASAKDAAFAALGDVNGQAFVVMVGLPALAALAIGARPTRVGTIALLLAAVAGAALVSMATRSALLGALVGVVVVVVLLARMSPRRTAAVAVTAAAAGWFLKPNLELLAGDRTTLYSRQDLWGVALDFWRQQPVVGNGGESWARLVAEQARITPNEGAGGTHNLFLSTLVGGGVVGLVLQLAVIGLVVVLGAVVLRGVASMTADRVAAAAGFGILTAILVRGLFEATGWPGVRLFDVRTWTGVLSWAAVVLILAAHEHVRGRARDLAAPAGGRP